MRARGRVRGLRLCGVAGGIGCRGVDRSASGPLFSALACSLDCREPGGIGLYRVEQPAAYLFKKH